MYVGDFSLSNLGSSLSTSFACLHNAKRHLAKAWLSTCPQSNDSYEENTIDQLANQSII